MIELSDELQERLKPFTKEKLRDIILYLESRGLKDTAPCNQFNNLLEERLYEHLKSILG